MYITAKLRITEPRLKPDTCGQIPLARDRLDSTTKKSPELRYNILDIYLKPFPDFGNEITTLRKITRILATQGGINVTDPKQSSTSPTIRFARLKYWAYHATPSPY
eukprot:sb/3477797/